MKAHHHRNNLDLETPAVTSETPTEAELIQLAEEITEQSPSLAYVLFFLNSSNAKNHPDQLEFPFVADIEGYQSEFEFGSN